MGKLVIDNRTEKLLDRLKLRLKDAAALRVVSAYFSIYGFGALADELRRLQETRFLYGDPGSIDGIDPGEKTDRAFYLLEQQLTPTEALRQKALAEQCEKWVEQPHTKIRSIVRSNFLHGKMWHIDKSSGSYAVVGSSNFTQRGLGVGKDPNIEINLPADDPQTCDELRKWFDELWNDKANVEDVKEEVLKALRRIGREWEAESVYFKTLYELFQEEWEAIEESDAELKRLKLSDAQIWKALYQFQKDGVHSILKSLNNHNGCLLADSVGLGKTYSALAVIKYHELRNERVLVLCPRKLWEQWNLYLSVAGHQGNPFPEDRFNYSLLSHTDLLRKKGKVGAIDLANFNWSGFDLVVIDESHNFRNSDGKRYKKLIDEIIKESVNTKVLMLSATPVNTSLIDLRNQIYLMTEGRDDAFAPSLNIHSLKRTLRNAQEQFNAWSPEHGKQGLLETLGADFQSILAAVTFSRSRKQIETFYKADMERVGAFPKREKPINLHPPTDRDGELSYEKLAEQIEQFQLSIYTPTNYLDSDARKMELEAEKKRRNFNQRDRERFLIGMIRVNFLKRLESAPNSLMLTLQRTVGKIDDLIRKIDLYTTQRSSDAELKEETAPYEATEEENDETAVKEDDDLIVNKGKKPFKLSELDVQTWREDLVKDRDILNEALRQVKAVTPERDGKLRKIKTLIRERAENPSLDQKGKECRKLIVYTTFKDTACYLYKQLTPLTEELGLKMAMVAGSETHTQHGDNNFHAILDNFAPAARKSKGGDADSAAADVNAAVDLTPQQIRTLKGKSHERKLESVRKQIMDGKDLIKRPNWSKGNRRNTLRKISMQLAFDGMPRDETLAAVRALAAKHGKDDNAEITRLVDDAFKQVDGALKMPPSDDPDQPLGDPGIDLLIATDCVSEGMNLQDCDRIVNYDIHWNPVRLIQRFGRIDRIGSQSRSIQMTNFWPTEDMEAYLRLESRVRSRMALADIAAAGDDGPLDIQEEEQNAKKELTFRYKQLLKMREEVAYMEDLEDAPAMSDFSFARFVGQLNEYLRQQRYELENMPDGAYAVVKQNGEAEPGVLFFLRQTNADPETPDKTASPFAPHYAVYVRDDGTIRYGCPNAQQILDIFEAAAVGKTEPIQEMCNLFNMETDNGQQMERYDELVQSASKNTPRNLGDFRLITWLVILDPDHERYQTGYGL